VRGAFDVSCLSGLPGRGLVLAAVAWIATAAQPTTALAQKGRTEVREGNALYAEGRYNEALEKYLDALRAAPNSPVIRFNEGNALYQSQEFQRALDAYREAVESGDPALEAKAWYNLGNALYRQQQLPEALEAYKQALRRDPGDVDAKHNLELLLEQLQQQEQQQEQQQQGDQGEQGEQQEQQEPQQGEDQREGEEQDQAQTQPESEQEAGQEGPPPQPQPGQMSREEAERLLQAINEDPDKIARKRFPVAERRKPKKDW
jgi:Ca-activated chloride channel family protein